MKLILPEDYDPVLSVQETQAAIKYIRDTFQHEFGKEMNLIRVSAPLFVPKSSGLNDNLNGTEQPVSFTMAELPDEQVEIVHSLAKWKRNALGEYGFAMHDGLYTNMNAIRKDEELDNLHSAYVDQWDWEKVIAKEERTEETLRAHVEQIFKVIKHMEHEVWYKYPQAVNCLPDKITFITSQELLDRYPDLSPKERENAATKEYGCIFLMKIGDRLSNGEKHDGRARTMMTGRLTAIFSSGTNRSRPRWKSRAWASVSMKRPFTASLKRKMHSTASLFLSIKRFSTANCPTPSAAVSVSPVFACFCSKKPTSAKSSLPCGLKKCAKPAKKPAFLCFKHQTDSCLLSYIR